MDREKHNKKNEKNEGARRYKKGGGIPDSRTGLRVRR